MKHIFLPLLTLLFTTTEMLYPFGSSESSIDGGKSSIVISGVIETYKGHRYNVQNITFNKITRKIALYELPSAQSNVITEQKTSEGQKELPADVVQLKDNPIASNTEFFIDLESITKITVPNPWQRWIFKKGHREMEFTEIVVSMKDKDHDDHYLVEKDKRIYAKEDDAIIEVPLVNLKSLTIDKIELKIVEKPKKIDLDKETPASAQAAPNKDKMARAKKSGMQTAHIHHRKGRSERTAKKNSMIA